MKTKIKLEVEIEYELVGMTADTAIIERELRHEMEGLAKWVKEDGNMYCKGMEIISIKHGLTKEQTYGFHGGKK